MSLTTDEAKKVCRNLGVAGVMLNASPGATGPIARRIAVIQGHLNSDEPATYDGDAAKAKKALDTVVDDLAKLSEKRPAVANASEPIRPNVRPELLPGVSDAIGQIGKAVEILRIARDRK